jgi:hypothetical protein
LPIGDTDEAREFGEGQVGSIAAKLHLIGNEAVVLRPIDPIDALGVVG